MEEAMIIHPAEQGSAAWTEARLGIPTASQFSRIITPGGKLSKSRDGYLAELLAEWALGEPVSDFLGTDWTERGHILEGEARAAYGLLRDADVTECGLCYRDDSRSAWCRVSRWSRRRRRADRAEGSESVRDAPDVARERTRFHATTHCSSKGNSGSPA